MFNVGPAEIMMILLIALIVFGPKRLPEIGKTVGKGLREFRKASQDIKDELSASMADEDEDAPATPTQHDQTTNLDGSAPNLNGDPGAAARPQLPGGAVPDS
jgi:sec-independent protein translocase protein TatA